MSSKFSYLMMAASVLFAASCETDEELVSVEQAATSTVSFNLSTPQMASRAYSDGMTATVLQYAVYDEAGNILGGFTTTDATIKGSTTVDLQLVTGNTYKVVFWAAAPNAPYTVDLAAKTMSVSYDNALCNDEARDAFYAYKEFTVEGAQSERIELKRPFAQINIGTSDYAEATKAGYTPTKSSVEVTGVANTLNLFTGEATGEVNASFAFAEIKKDETFPVDGNEYLAMNYVLVGAEKQLVDVAFSYTDDSKTKDRVVSSVPVQRNYRTNIYGKLLTSQVDINVEIKPEYNEPANEADALYLAAAVGGEITLTEDVVLTDPLNVQANMTINLNGKTISGNWGKNDGPVIKNSANLKLIGGTVKSLAENGGSALQNNGTAVIEGTTLNGAPNANGSWPSYTVNNTGSLTLNNSKITSYHGAVSSYGAEAVVTLNNCVIDMTGIAGFTSHGIYTYNGGKVVVNGGTYQNKATDQNASGASVINGNVEVNAGTFNGRIENYYGTPVLKGGTYSVEPKKNFVAAGFKVLKQVDKYIVVANDIDNYASTEIVNLQGVVYSGEYFENTIANALYFKNWYLEGDATIKVDGITYGAIILENVKGNLNGDAIVINNDNNSVMILDNCDFTLAEGKKLIKSTNKIYQVFMTDITINGVKLTNENAEQYLENVEWFQIVEEI